MFLTAYDSRVKKEVDKADFGRISIAPLPSGYGYTLGASLRRVLLSSIEGSAPTQVEIAGITHQFTTIEGVKEDVVEITLNLKKLRVKVHGDNPVVLTLNEKGDSKVRKITAKDFECPADAEVINKDLHIATLTDKKAKLEMKLLVERGFGYVPSEERNITKVGVIALDSIFTPVLSVGYKVEKTRVARETGADKLVMEIKTDGTIAPYDAFLQASKQLASFFERLSTGKETMKDETEEEVPHTNVPNYEPSEVVVEELHLPTRTINALRKANINTLSELAKLSNEELSNIRNLGDKSIREINKLLIKEGLKNETQSKEKTSK